MLNKIHQTVFAGFFLLAVFCGISLTAEDAVLTVYVTRHAQRGPRTQWPKTDQNKIIIGETINGKTQPPAGDSITPLGVQQAKLLGEHLKKLGFKGKIISSPNYRTMQTAVTVAQALDPVIKVIPEPMMQEGGNRNAPEKGITIDELMNRFPGNVEPVKLPALWQFAGETTAEHRNKRMAKYLDELLQKNPAGELLLVGHSSTLPSLIIAINGKMDDKRFIIPHYPEYLCNCCLYVFRFDKNGKVIDAELENWKYLSEDMMTLNFSKRKKIAPWKKNRFAGVGRKK